MLEQVARQEASLRSGQLSAVLVLGPNTRSTAEIQFSLEGAEPRLRSSTTYTGTEGSRTLERIIAGGQAWQRQQGSGWTAMREEEGVVGHLRSYLPGASAARDVSLSRRDSRSATLQWYDPTRDADVTLEVDVATNAPLRLSRTVRSTQSALTVTYVGWNIPVVIESPR